MQAVRPSYLCACLGRSQECATSLDAMQYVQYRVYYNDLKNPKLNSNVVTLTTAANPTIAKIDITGRILMETVGDIMKNHTALRVVLRVEDDHPYFGNPLSPDLPVYWYKYTTSDEVEAVKQWELCASIPHGDRLWRLIFMEDEKDSSSKKCLIVFNHTIMDACSALNLHQEFWEKMIKNTQNSRINDTFFSKLPVAHRVPQQLLCQPQDKCSTSIYTKISIPKNVVQELQDVYKKRQKDYTMCTLLTTICASAYRLVLKKEGIDVQTIQIGMAADTRNQTEPPIDKGVLRPVFIFLDDVMKFTPDTCLIDLATNLRKNIKSQPRNQKQIEVMNNLKGAAEQGYLTWETLKKHHSMPDHKLLVSDVNSDLFVGSNSEFQNAEIVVNSGPLSKQNLVINFTRSPRKNEINIHISYNPLFVSDKLVKEMPTQIEAQIEKFIQNKGLI